MGCTKRELLAWVKETYGIEPDYPWADNNAVLRHQPSRKWFAVLLDVGKQKLGLSGEGNVDVVNLKCDRCFPAPYGRSRAFYPPTI